MTPPTSATPFPYPPTLGGLLRRLFVESPVAAGFWRSGRTLTILLTVSVSAVFSSAAPSPANSNLNDLSAAVVDLYCYDCHGSASKKGDLMLEGLDLTNPATNAVIWEKVARKLDHRQMPPLGEDRPDDATYRDLVTHIVSSLDRAAVAAPNPGRTDTFRRLTRTEYQNAIRDLLALEIDATSLLPNDEPSHGFDNVTVGTLSPTLLDRYVSAAQKIAS